MSKSIRALQIRHVDAGSCNGCEQELTALTSGYYDIQRHGIDLVASPRHADALLVTGPVTDTMALAVKKVWEAIPSPKLRIAFGACALGCGVFQNGYASEGGVKEADLEIPGCPPEPERALAILRDWMRTHRSGQKAYSEIAPDSQSAV